MLAPRWVLQARARHTAAALHQAHTRGAAAATLLHPPPPHHAQPLPFLKVPPRHPQPHLVEARCVLLACHAVPKHALALVHPQPHHLAAFAGG